jgi:hypothetical protein
MSKAYAVVAQVVALEEAVVAVTAMARAAVAVDYFAS